MISWTMRHSSPGSSEDRLGRFPGSLSAASGAASSDPQLGESLDRANAEQRELRPEIDAGIAGTKSGALKCLHAHAAFALARPGYVLGEQILEEVGERWCPDRRCAAATEVAP